MTEGLNQITIPEFDEDEFSSPLAPFARAANAFGGFGFGFSSGADSPTFLASAAGQDREFFHTRQDSNASEDSAFSSFHTPSLSTPFAARSNTSIPFAHSSQTSLPGPSAHIGLGTSSSTATSASTGPPSTPFTKKSSFASLRNAFKNASAIGTGRSSGGGDTSTPPLPPLGYPVLRNPFSRSSSALAHHSQSSLPRSPPSSHGHGRAMSMRTRAQISSSIGAHSTPSHVHGRSQHSHNGSVFNNTDSDGDYAFGFNHISARSATPPPVPHLPNEFGVLPPTNGAASETAGRYDIPPVLGAGDRVVIDPRTPSEYALHAIFMRFAAVAEDKITQFLKKQLDREPPLTDMFGQSVDTTFDDLLASLGRIAVKSTKPVVDSIMRWRKSQLEIVSDGIVELHTATSSAYSTRPVDVVNVLNERKSLASIYIMCRALISVVQSIPRDALNDSLGNCLEEITFDQFRRPDIKLLAQSRNHRINAELYAVLLGKLSSIRFFSVTDRFLAELTPVSMNQISKDMEVKYENLVRALRYIEVKVWPPESFEEGAEFMEGLAKCFEHTHGLRLKIAFAETLIQLLHPIGKTAQVEVNHPIWEKAMEIIFPKARDMMGKPRYWQVAYPLVITCLCVSPQGVFLRHWTACFESGLQKLKDKPFRVIIMNGMMRLIWTYLYRCNESISASTSRLDNILKHFFPSSRHGVNPPDERLEPLIYIVHFILSKHFDFGCDLVLNLMQEQQINFAQNQTVNTNLTLASERVIIAVEATLRSLYLIEKDEPSPSWPSNADFTKRLNADDYPLIATLLPPSLKAKPGMEEFINRCGSTIASLSITCAKAVGRMSIFDDQWSFAHTNTGYDDSANLVIRQHLEASVAYPITLSPQVTILRTCFLSWPRCLHPSLPLDDALDMLIRAIIHVEPALCDAACGALERIAMDKGTLPRVLSRFAAFLFSAKQFMAETAGTRLPFESTRLLNVWFGFVESWAKSVIKGNDVALDETRSAWVNTQFFDVETAALFLLSSRSQSSRVISVKLLRILEEIVFHFHDQLSTPLNESSDSAFRILNVLLDKGRSRTYFDGLDDLLDTKQQDRLAQWRNNRSEDVLLRLATSEDMKDWHLWLLVYPAIIRTRMNHQSKVIVACREMWIAATTRYNSAIVSISGVNGRVMGHQTTRVPVSSAREKAIEDNIPTIEQWHMWLKLVCSTASPPEPRAQHARAPSEGPNDRDFVASNTRRLFRFLVPFLESDYSIFRDIAVLCISSFPADAYRDLLEDLGSFAAKNCYVNLSRAVMSPTLSRRSRRQERLYLAVAHIYQLTAHYLKDQRGVGRQDSLTNVLKFVRHTQAFLSSPEVRSDWQQQRLRRYFCGIVERLFDGLSTLQASDRFIPVHTHLTLYRLCEEWCQCGSQSERVKQRLITMQTAATAGFPEPRRKASAIALFQTETRLLSHAAAGAMASLCQKALFPPDLSSGSPNDRMSSSDFLMPLEVAPTLDRLVAMLASMHDSVKACGRKALRSLVDHKVGDSKLVDEVLQRSFVTSKDPETSSYRFFEVVADVICTGESCQLAFAHVVCLGIANLCSSLIDTRKLALAALYAAHAKTGGSASLLNFEARVGSSAATVYLDAQYQISELLAQEHPTEAIDVVVQASSKLSYVHGVLEAYAFSHILNALSPWFSSMELLTEDDTSLSKGGRVILYHMVSLTLRYSEAYPEQIHSLWSWLVNNCSSNGHATIRFLLENASKVGSNGYVSCARKIVAYLSRTSYSRPVFEELCGNIEPTRMLPTIDHKLNFPDSEEADLWADLDALFSEQPKHSLGAGQFALLFLGDVALPRAWEFKKQLPVILHGIFTHLGHRNPFVRDQARKMLFQNFRAWLSGYDELAEHSSLPSQSTIKNAVTEAERDSDSLFWTEDDAVSRIAEKINHLCSIVLEFLEPLHSALADDWGSLALLWGTTCSIRPIAFRSLQIFRSLMPKVTQADLAQLLGRLSNTIAAQESSLHPFTVELIITLKSVAQSENLDSALLPQLYWCTVSCLSTPVEAEFSQLIDLLECVLGKLDLNDSYTVEVLVANRPADFEAGPSALQPLLLIGLRSTETLIRTFRLLERLSGIQDATLIDPSGGRVRDMYTFILPWCLRLMEEGKADENVAGFALNISRFAELEERPSIARIMTSFAKSRFRTKDDFMRQAAAALREHYAPHSWTEVVSLLMSLVLNQERWLQAKSMQFLKVLFQLRETRSPVDRLGSELLMPLLRLLHTDLAPQALEVLEEPMTISGGLSAKHVLRMSMNLNSIPQRDVDAVTEVFGMPEDSGWSVARPDRQREICRANVMAVFDTCKVPTRPSCIDFEPEVDRFADPIGEDLGDLVQNLHELSTYFLGDPDAEDQISQGVVNPAKAPKTQPPPLPTSVPHHQLEARVAAILAKSTDMAAVLGSPHTPLIDVFNVKMPPALGGHHKAFNASDDESVGSDFDADTFAFDSSANFSSDSGHHHQPIFFGNRQRHI